MFYEWLQAKMKEQGLGVRELCRLAGVSSGTISRILNGTRGPGPVLCQKLSKVLDIPETVVFEQAGLLSAARGEAELTRRELWELLNDLPVEEQRAILADARARWERAHKDALGIEPATS